MSRLAERYKSEVATALQKEFGYTNVMAVSYTHLTLPTILRV